jgi:hypothetical protein
VRRAAALADARLGRVVIGGLPPEGSVIVGAKAYHNGDTYKDIPGTYVLTATADSYDPLSKQINLVAGRTDTVIFNLTKQGVTVAQTQQRANLPLAPRDSEQVRFAVRPPYAAVYVDGTQIGTGMIARKIPVGAHQVRYSAPNCDAEDRSITVMKGDLLNVPMVQLNCR